ncbi:MAG: hypothetical protein DHS20C21_16500 [Gemmatimonadota bacterium]|nr:MAG: hypothetical protein DHS20C21_16500 [Gemmatimonadota bacterium]
MSGAAIAVGDKLHIITRRQFEEDVRRHFVGQVTAVSGALQEIQGYAFVFDSGTNEYKRRPELRTRVLSVGEGTFIVTKLPPDVVVESLQYRVVEKRVVVSDGKAFKLDINEFGGSR